jgi:hypothetical protein
MKNRSVLVIYALTVAIFLTKVAGLPIFDKASVAVAREIETPN